MFPVAYESLFAGDLVLPLAEGTADVAGAGQAAPLVLVITATILVALALRTASRAVVSIIAQIARAAIPAGMAALMLIGALAIVVYVVAIQV